MTSRQIISPANSRRGNLSPANSRRGKWYTPAELAGLPGLPDSSRRVRAFAEANGWHDDKANHRRRRGKGGGREYRAEVLPEATQNYLARRALTQAEPPAAAPPAAAAPTTAAQEGKS